jgi:hypothetical protein
LHTINASAFYACANLIGTLEIPKSVTLIGESAFSSCSITSLTFEYPSALHTINVNAFLTFTPRINITGQLSLPDSITQIDIGAFNRTSISSVANFPNNSNFVKIASGIFANCPNLTSIATIPNSVTEIGESAFQNLSLLSGTILIPDNVTAINQNAFKDTDINLSMEPTTFNDVAQLANDNEITLQQKQTLAQHIFNTSVNADTRIQISCFSENTHILCMNDKYIPIKELTKKSFVKTLDGSCIRVKYILKGTLTNGSPILTHNMYKMKNSNLMITGGHSILVDELTDTQKELQRQFWGDAVYKINDKFLLLSCCSEQFEKVEDTNEYIYYHIVLENNDPEKHFGIWADGVLTESISEKVYLTHL